LFFRLVIRPGGGEELVRVLRLLSVIPIKKPDVGSVFRLVIRPGGGEEFIRTLRI
jgi:hypothetical protein